MPFSFDIIKKLPGTLARAGVIHTPHGDIETPAFIVVGTKATVKALTPEQVAATGAQAVLANTYHLYLEPGPEAVAHGGGLGAYMHWSGPTVTDSGGFQVFSLGAAFGKRLSKFSDPESVTENIEGTPSLATIDDDGVTFRSHLDGSEHRFTAERSIQIQHQLGADILFAFDECPAPTAPADYQQLALERTHAWADRSLAEHRRLGGDQALFGVVQGGRDRILREASARFFATREFDGFGIGGTFDKGDMETAVAWVNAILPEEKPRHLLGIGGPEDFFAGVLAGGDTFDCVLPTRNARNGSLFTREGIINIRNAEHREALTPIEADCECYTCQHFTRAYLAHLFRAKEILAATLATIHNVHWSVNLVADIRRAILDGTLPAFHAAFQARYQR